jgi:hypothetical protein
MVSLDGLIIVILCAVAVCIPGIIGYTLAKLFGKTYSYSGYDSYGEEVNRLNRLTAQQNALIEQDIRNKLIGRYDRSNKNGLGRD